MKRLFVLLGLVFITSLAAQESGSLDWDIESLFDLPLPEAPSKETEEPVEFSALDLVRRQGFTFDGTFEFVMGFVPGLEEAPWYTQPDGAKNGGLSWAPTARMKLRFDLDAQISEIFRVKTSLFFIIPGFELQLGDFFFDYNLGDKFFLRGGKFNHSWGISPNFAFTNLIARVPDNPRYKNEPFLLKADIPLGIGGIQLLTLTRMDLIENEDLKYYDMGYGGKLNLAFRWADIDFGAFHQEGMPLRSFLSVKTTIGKTELYNEWLGAIDAYYPPDYNGDNLNYFRDFFNGRLTKRYSGAVNLGFIHDFFNGKLTTNGEVFYNSERHTFYYRPETSISEAETALFNDGLNIAFNVLCRLRGKGSPRLFFQTLYAPGQESAQLVPGFRLSPWNHVEFYFAIPMAVGRRDGHYYSNTADPRNLSPPRPFCIVMMVTLKGNIKIGQYE